MRVVKATCKKKDILNTYFKLLKSYLWWFEWIVCWEMDGEEEDTSLIWRLWWSHDCSLPMEQIVTDGPCGALCGWITAQILEFLKQMLIQWN